MKAPSTTQEFAMRPVLFLALAAFGAFSLHVMWEIGYFGIWQAATANVGTWQLLLDFVILSFLAAGYMVRDARRTGRTVWPFVAITIAAGSFGPLLYLVLQPAGSREFPAASAAATR
jgi:hypothetical protein